MTDLIPARVRRARLIVRTCVMALAIGLTAASAVLTKRAMTAPPLAAVEARQHAVQPVSFPEPAAIDSEWFADARVDAVEIPADPEIRYFDGRPVRPARVIWMTVTAYSPDHRSCAPFADGITASGRSVWTNAGRLVAADTRILPFHSMISIPGYADSEIVPVLDRGAAIKGARLDVLYPTHGVARKWGVQRLPITVWEYAD